jgi:putative membrane protein
MDTEAMTSDDADPRYSLANERTFLAWIRTGLGLLAGAAGLLAIDLPWPTAAVRGLAILLSAAAGLSACLAWNRWRSVEAAIQASQQAPRPRAHVWLALVVAVVAVAVIALTIA